ncbi:unnamed protein product [Paramecium pentaurelia]|uniref:Protein kinase domain-containing protein n=1 Tax=Paramecium pentaurelia TaxID=43138 RepID=A0A8S1RVY9_9CILI|nr:unnamed protein product [Paramecium pentaurelia]
MQQVQALPPQFFQAIKIQTILGEGHDAKVLLALETKENENKQYALKCQAQKIQDTAINLFNEIQILIHIKHHHIIELYGYSQDYTCLVLQYCPHGTLVQLIKSSPLPVSIAASLMYQVTLALTYMHEQGFTHGDLKLSNVLIDSQYNIKLCDFGFARWNGKMAIEKQTIAGSEGYTAPEIWTSNPNYIKSDMFSVAVIFFILITGHPPFESNNPDNHDPWWNLIKNSQWDTYWKDIRSNIDQECKNLFVQMFSIQPEERLSANHLNQWFKLKQTTQENLIQEIKKRLAEM